MTIALRGFPFGRGDEGRMGAGVRVLAAARLTERDAMADDLAGRAARPAVVPVGAMDAARIEETRERRPALAAGASLEQLADHRGGDAIGLEALALPGAPVAGRNARGHVNAALDGCGLRLRPSLPALLELPLRDGAEDVGDESAAGSLEVEPVVDGDERPALVLGRLDELRQAAQRTSEPVELRGDDPAAFVAPAAGERPLERRTLQRAAGDVEILVPGIDREAARLRVGLDLLALDLRADEGFALATRDATDPDVTVHLHVGQSKPSAGCIRAERDAGGRRRALARVAARHSAVARPNRRAPIDRWLRACG